MLSTSSKTVVYRDRNRGKQNEKDREDMKKGILGKTEIARGREGTGATKNRNTGSDSMHIAFRWAFSR